MARNDYCREGILYGKTINVFISSRDDITSVQMACIQGHSYTEWANMTKTPSTPSLTHDVLRAYGCGYCAAHCAALGTIWKGDKIFLAKNVSAMAPSPDPKIFNPQELAAINISKKVGPVPSEVSTEDIKNMAEVFTEREQEAVVNCAVVMGFLNRFM